MRYRENSRLSLLCPLPMSKLLLNVPECLIQQKDIFFEVLYQLIIQFRVMIICLLLHMFVISPTQFSGLFIHTVPQIQPEFGRQLFIDNLKSHDVLFVKILPIKMYHNKVSIIWNTPLLENLCLFCFNSQKALTYNCYHYL